VSRPHIAILFFLKHGHPSQRSQKCRSGCDHCLSYPPYLSALLCADDFLFPLQLGEVGVMDDSDEELQLIDDVARLDSQLKQAGCPCDENLYFHLFRDLNVKPLAKRLKLWCFRKELLREKLVACQLSRSALSAASGETAATPPPVEPERKRKLRILRLRTLQHN
jgi:hypothetical protein